MLKRALVAPLLAGTSWAQKTTTYAYVGCYTTEQRHGHGDGIHVYRMDPETGAWTHLQRVGNLVNPSFLIVSRDQRFLYSVHGDEHYATSFAVNKDTGSLTRLNQAETGGSNGAHVAIDRSGRFLLVANYATASVGVLPLRPDGSLADNIQVVSLKGEHGPHRTEQASSHPHHIVFDPSGRFVAVPDKGLDRIFVFRFDAESGKLTENGSVMTRPGAGPRHIAFHPKLPVAWVINELNSTVTTYHWDAEQGALRPMQTLPSIPADFTGANTGAEIVVSSDGRFVYCSNRGHDSVAIYGVNAPAGSLTSIGWAPTQGKGPRYIGLDPSQRFLYATNERGDTVVGFHVDPVTGRLTPTGQVIQNASPVTIAFANGL
jgi:6-phosphogluconolactonase